VDRTAETELYPRVAPGYRDVSSAVAGESHIPVSSTGTPATEPEKTSSSEEEAPLPKDVEESRGRYLIQPPSSTPTLYGNLIWQTGVASGSRYPRRC
jgi:hypothetical protein